MFESTFSAAIQISEINLFEVYYQFSKEDLERHEMFPASDKHMGRLKQALEHYGELRTMERSSDYEFSLKQMSNTGVFRKKFAPESIKNGNEISSGLVLLPPHSVSKVQVIFAPEAYDRTKFNVIVQAIEIDIIMPGGTIDARICPLSGYTDVDGSRAVSAPLEPQPLQILPHQDESGFCLGKSHAG